MPFKWTDSPNPPSTDLPVPVPPGEITYEQKLVANLVNAGGTLSYNTPDVAFDILYELPTANVNVANFTNCSFNNITVNTANITTASINVANINTANILSANILYGFVGGDPTSNLGIASKHYVDAAAANVPTGGSDLQNLINAKGDLLVANGFHSATRFPIGTDGQILITDTAAPTRLRWVTIAGQELFYNLVIRTHYDLSGNDHQVLLQSASEIIMNDGTRTAGWQNMVVDIELSGASGLDTGVEEADTWYEIHAIRSSSNGATALILHKAQQLRLDQSFTTTSDTGVTLKKLTGGTATKIGQSFIPTLAGPLTSIEVEISKTGSPTGLIWLTLETDNGSGFPSGSVLATSRVMDVGRLPTDKARMRFLFDTNTSVSLATTYHLVIQADYTASDSDYITAWGLSAGGYGDGRANEFRVAWFTSSGVGGVGDLWFKIFVKSTMQTSVSLPTGYDQRCLISYVYNDSNKKLKQYAQKNRSMVMSMSADWKCFTSITGLLETVDLAPFIPPVLCSVFFSSRLLIGGPSRNNPIGGIACTDLPIGDTPSVGAITANTSAADTVSINTCAQYGVIVLEEPVLLCRMQNVNARLYVTGLLF